MPPVALALGPLLTGLLAAAPAVAAVGSVAGSIYQGVEAANQKDKAQQAADQQRADQERLKQEAIAREANEKKQAEIAASRTAASSAQQAASGEYTGRQGTLLTGPLGDVAAPTTGGKTLLGI